MFFDRKFSKGKTSDSIRGLFSDHGVMGMLQASAYENVDNLSPFLEATLDGFCGFTEATEKTTAYVQ